MSMRSVAAIGAHPDDIELGCGGTLAAHRAAGDRVAMPVVTGGQNGPGLVPARRAAAEAAARNLDCLLQWGHLQDTAGTLDPGTRLPGLKFRPGVRMARHLAEVYYAADGTPVADPLTVGAS